MPLTMANMGAAFSVSQIHGKDDTRRFLESLGFVSGALVTVITETQGNLIVNVKDTRVAISKAMASKIHVA
jgi:ferrous iron transport protein A